jgi:hypothetical protein
MTLGGNHRSAALTAVRHGFENLLKARVRAKVRQQRIPAQVPFASSPIRDARSSHSSALSASPRTA